MLAFFSLAHSANLLETLSIRPKQVSTASLTSAGVLKVLVRGWATLIVPKGGGGYLGIIRPPEALLYSDSPPPFGYNKSCPAIVLVIKKVCL